MQPPFQKENLLELLSHPGVDLDVLLEAVRNGNVHIQNQRGFTPLMLVVLLYDEPDLVDALVACGADVNAETQDGMTALMWALHGETPPDSSIDGLFQEKERKRILVVQKLIDAGADVNATCYSKRRMKWTPLLFATLEPDRNMEAITSLIRAGADVNAATLSQITPIFHAVARGRFADSVRALINAGADLHIQSSERGREGWTPLLYALTGIHRSLDIIKELLRHGAKVNFSVQNGITPLLFAVNANDPALVEELLRAEANPNASDKQGNTPLACARAHSNKKIERLLRKAGAYS